MRKRDHVFTWVITSLFILAIFAALLQPWHNTLPYPAYMAVLISCPIIVLVRWIVWVFDQ